MGVNIIDCNSIYLFLLILYFSYIYIFLDIECKVHLKTSS